ncbi:MAG: CARDB domain-containing protein [Chitinophagaceae bacterium]
MKKYLLLVIILASAIFSYAQDPAYPSIPPGVANITAAESFIDTDPGVGSGAPISIVQAVNINNAIAVINVNGLANGVHRLYIRTRNNEGRWSITNVKEFLYDANPVYSAPVAAQNIIAAEFYIDTDPGFGSGTPIALAPGVNINNVSVSVSTTGLLNGTHRLYVRSKNLEGRWSITQIKEFIVDFNFAYPAVPAAAQNIISAEYFFDNDPGFGQGNAIAVAAGTDLTAVTANINPTGLSIGTHRLYIRSKNRENSWAITLVKDFIVDSDFSYPAVPDVAQQVTAAEYFIDTDPGFGGGTAFNFTPGTDVSGVVASINTAGLGIGTHRVYVRSRSQEGRWSITLVKDFIVNSDFSYPVAPAGAQQISAAEYFIDADPGFGKANPISVTPGADISNLSVSVSTAGLTSGIHHFCIRTKNQEGNWSLVANDSFATGFIQLSADTLLFGNVPAGSTIIKNLVVTNASNSSQTIENISTQSPFSTNFSGVITVAAGQTATVPVSFAPAAAHVFSDSLIVQTSAGVFRVVLNGTGIHQTASWTIDPAVGYDYGNIAIGATASTSFTIRNTGNIPIDLSSFSASDPAFTASVTPGTIVPVNGTVAVPVLFAPTAINQYSSQVKIISATAGVDTVTTVVRGSGYAPGTPPVLQYLPAVPYNSAGGVNPAVGQTGLFTYKILYTSAANRAPQAGYPKVGIDLNGDNDFDDLEEGTFNMIKEGIGTDYITGVVYSYTFSHNNERSMAGYQFFAVDDNGNAASVTNTYKNGPVVTNQQPDLRIFANNISFSNNNPLPGETFTVTATISNSTAVPVTNVPVNFYRDTILIGSAVLPAVNAFSSSSISRALNFSAEGFFPIKVWIDSSNTLGESNILNNYAIRPVTVGSPALPGGITVTSTASVQQCPRLTVLISGNAVYFGTGSATLVAGAAVTINTGTQLLNTSTDANGNYSVLYTPANCGGSLTYTVSITDFTFTSALVTASIALPCPGLNTCSPPPSQGGMLVGVSSAQCSNLVGGSANLTFTLKYRSRNISNMWCPFDEIIKDTLKVFANGVLVQTLPSADYTHGPGEERVIPVSLPLTTTDPVTITGELSYTYIEYLQIPTSIYHGNFTKMVATGGGSIEPEQNLADLAIQTFTQTGFTAFHFDDANVKCGPAGAHSVLVFDSLPGGAVTLLKTTRVSALGGSQSARITLSEPGMTPGTHFIKIVTDADAEVPEQDEANNVFIASVLVPKPDLIIQALNASPTAMPVGTNIQFTATVKNTGKQADSFYVRFTVNNVQLGALKKVAFIGEKSTVQVSSDFYTINNADNTCGVTVNAHADFTGMVDEALEGNNDKSIAISSDLSPYQLPTEYGSAGRPVIVRVNSSQQFYPAIRNIGERDVNNVSVKYLVNGNPVGTDSIASISAGELFAAHGSFAHIFTMPGDYTVQVVADTANSICENDEGNNTGNFYIRVVDSKPDLEVLSQYISPSSLNPNAGQSISIVGTVKNVGGKISTASVLRFMVDDIQLGADVAVNALQPGTDTTVAATATYASIIAGVKVMKIAIDLANTVAEEREDNNEATRTLIVGDAPDMSRGNNRAIRFSPAGFSAGDSVTVTYRIRNNGVQQGTAWARFLVYDSLNTLKGIDSVQFTLAAGDSAVISKKMLFNISNGTVITQIVRCTPVEFDLLNNNDTLAFSTIVVLKAATVVNSNLDMKAALPDMLPGWIGGKLVLGAYDLVIHGTITNFDTAHFIVTNGAGRLKLINSNADNTFPVGVSADNASFVQINNTGTPDNYTVRVMPYVLQNGSNGDTVKSGYVNRTWLIDEETAGGSDATVTFSWNAADEQAGFDRAQSRTAHYAGNWQLGDIGNAQALGNGRFSKSQAGYNSFSPFSVTSLNAALPLHLIQFTAVAKENSALLKWQTTDEVNTSYFSVQYSADGIQFKEIGQVAAVNRIGENAYSFIHAHVGDGVHYYRLRMIDRDGQFTYSGIRMVRLTQGTTLQVFPNPAQRFVTVKGLEANGSVCIRTIDGRQVYQSNTTTHTLVIDLGKLPGGIYILTYLQQGKMQQQKIVKQ